MSTLDVMIFFVRKCVCVQSWRDSGTIVPRAGSDADTALLGSCLHDVSRHRLLTARSLHPAHLYLSTTGSVAAALLVRN